MDFLRNENLWLYLPLLVWIGVIAYFSSGVNSISQTAQTFIPLLKLLFPRADAVKLKNYHVVIRKLGHLTSYATLALLASVAFYNSSVISQFWHVAAFAVVLFIASADEIRQHFDPTREGSLRDVALDCLGGLTAISLFWIFALSFLR